MTCRSQQVPKHDFGQLRSSQQRNDWTTIPTKVSPQRRRDDMPPTDGSSTAAYRFVANQAVMDPEIAADLRTDGRIAVPLNDPYGGGIITHDRS